MASQGFTSKGASLKRITLDSFYDLSTVDEFKIGFKSPTGVKGSWTATAVAVTKLRHEFAKGELNEIGTWEARAYVKVDDREIEGEPFKFNVDPAIINML